MQVPQLEPVLHTTQCPPPDISCPTLGFVTLCVGMLDVKSTMRLASSPGVTPTLPLPDKPAESPPAEEPLESPKEHP